MNEKDEVNHPEHYQTESGIEAIDVIEALDLGFHLGNVIKYIFRVGKKAGDPEVDIMKAMWYLDRELRLHDFILKPNTRVIDPCEITKACYDLVVHNKALESADSVIAIGTGGLWPAAIVANLLSVPVIGVVPMRRTQLSDKSWFAELVIPSVLDAFMDSKRTVVVDDICDTGATFSRVHAVLPKCMYASLYAKPAGIKQCQPIYVEEVPQDLWLEFPWELSI